MKIRRILALGLAAVFTISLFSGCAKNEKSAGDTKVAKENPSAMGRYLEEEIPLPEEMSRILDIRLLDDGSIGGIMSGDEGPTILWKTQDYGQTWDKQYELSIDNKEQEFLSEATLCKDGSTLYVVSKIEGAVIQEIYWKSDETGNKTKFDITLPEVPGMSEGIETGTIFSFGDETDTDNQTDEDSVDDQEGEVVNKVIEGDEKEITAVEADGEGSIQDSIRKFRVGENGEVIAETTMNRIFQIDVEAGEIIKEYSIAEESYIVDIAVIASKVYVETNIGLDAYDLETGDIIELGEALTSKLNKGNVSDASGGGYTNMGQGGTPITTKEGDDAGTLYLADNTGVYRQGDGGTVLEQIVDASLTSLSIPDLAVNELLALADDTFVIHTLGENYGEDNLYHYVYSAEAKTTPESEIRVYSLEDNREIRQAIALYQKANPDVMVSLQVGMTGEEGITVSDALNTLNTEIMAGKGPDLLVLDGMPIESYVEKGILADISDVIDKIEAEDGILESVRDAHAIASRFSVPYVQGEEEYLDAIKNITTLNTAVKVAKETYPDKKGISGYNIEDMVRSLYRVDVSNFISTDGTLEKEALKNFFEQTKGIVQNSQEEKANEEPSNDEEGATEPFVSGEISVPDATQVAIELLLKEVIIGQGEIKTQNDLATLIAMNEKNQMKYKFLADDASKNIILTNTILGINSKGEHIEETKGFLAFCLTKEAQMSTQRMGLPVNKEALNETLSKDFEEMGLVVSAQAEDGTMKLVELIVNKPSEVDIKAFMDIILEETKVGYANRIVEEIIMEQLVNCVEERITIDEAVEATNQKVSLYLSE